MAVTTSGVASAFESPTFDKDGSFFVNKPVGSMSISPCGRDVVLASRQGLHVIDLDSPWDPPRYLQHLTPWEVADVQWSPFASRDYWVVSTSNQKALVWNLAMSTPSGAIEHVLHAHTRAITDINFSAHHPDLLATCAVDSFIHCWDLRFPARPAISFCDWFAGATQVKWNRQEGHIIASAHDKVLHIWDDRKGAYPLRSIVAHSTKIYGIDWNRTESRKLVTCSLDKTVKFWNCDDESDGPERTLHTDFPVWRARHTPFGQGLLAMPQRNDYNLHLYDRRPESIATSSQEMPCVKKFTGHESHVKEFLWRARGSVDDENDQREWQLVTWSSDLTLRLHRMTDQDLGLVGYIRGETVRTKLMLTRRDAPYKTFREDPGKAFSPQLRTTVHVGQPSNDLDSAFELYQPPIKSIVPTPSAALGGWMSSGFVNLRPSPMNRSTTQKDLDPITWMKGVKIGKREASAETTLPSVTSPNFKDDEGTEKFESLGDEITHVGTKFARVEFLRVEVQKRYVQISILGPWGSKHSMTYLNCRIDFPTDYPNLAHPVVRIEQTASLSEETISTLQVDARRLGVAFQAYGKPSFEALIQFLQGEQTVDDLTSWAKDDLDASIYNYGAISEGSSSDDEDEFGTFVGQQDSDVGMTGSGVLSVSNANVNVPLARTCGAIWSPDGRLVCFFSQKEEVSQSLAGSLGLEDFASFSRFKKRGYESLGRFNSTAATAKSKNSSLGTMESDGSDSEYSSDSSDISSSSSWLSQGEVGSKGHYLGPRIPMRPSISPFQGPDHLADEARRSNASLSGTKSRLGRGKCFVSVKDMSQFLPCHSKLATSYDLTTSDAGVTNAAAAREQGFDDLANSWLIIDMILKGGPLIKMSAPLRNHDSPATPSTQAFYALPPISDDNINMQAALIWADHPFGKSFLIEKLFRHFAQVGDIQMLAAMSCIFQSLPTSPTTSYSQDNACLQRSVMRRTFAALLPSPSLLTPEPLDYFTPLDSSTRVEMDLDTSLEGTERKRLGASSLSSSLGATGNEGRNIYAPAVTPPSTARLSRRSSDQPGSEPLPISPSTERIRWTQRSSSQIASALSSSFHRPFFTASASSSPPNTFSKKKVSPIGSFATTLSQQASLRTFSRSMSTSEELKVAGKSVQAARVKRGDSAKSRIPKFHVKLKNKGQFRDIEYSDNSLLSPSKKGQYAVWRRHYADLLASWGLFLNRAEVLKFNGTFNDNSTEIHRGTTIEIGKRWSPSDSAANVDADVALVQYCNQCNMLSASAGSTRGRCSHRQLQAPTLICLLCAEYIRGRSRPCLNCGHVMHSACWDAAVSAFGAALFECLSGCGCRCGEHAQVSGHRIDMEESDTPSPPVRLAGDAPEVPSATESALPWEDVAYESLVKNLGGLRRGSKPWRTKGRASVVRGS